MARDFRRCSRSTRRRGCWASSCFGTCVRCCPRLRWSGESCTIVSRASPARCFFEVARRENRRRRSRACASGRRPGSRNTSARSAPPIAARPARCSSPTVDFVMPQRDTHYMAFFVRAENARMNAFHEKFFELTGTPESVSRGHAVARGCCAPAPAARAAELADRITCARCRESRRGRGVARRRARARARWRRQRALLRAARVPICRTPPAGSRASTLERSRQASVDHRRQSIKAALFKERTSPGVNLTWMLDAWWFLPVESFWTLDEQPVAVAADEIARAPGRSPGRRQVPDRSRAAFPRLRWRRPGSRSC